LYGLRDDVRAFAADVAERRGLPPGWLASQLARARRVEAVRKLVMPAPPGIAKNWAAYRARFIEPHRIEAGVAFWRQNDRWLHEAEQRYGVPAEIVVGVVGVETFYGRVTGNFRILDALATLSFDFPAGRKDRSAFFRAELEEFFVLCAREGADPQLTRGSYAGAIGLPQFMPGSINRHAVDLDGDGRIDLLTDTADVVGSVAHFLAQAGWQPGQATHFEVKPPADAAQRAYLLEPDILPSFTAAQMAEHGALLDESGRGYNGAMALVELQNGEHEPSYVAGTANFYAVTRYNPSSYYAMAVIDLATAVARLRGAQG
jgi:membrane-bound lytic murein transglycosylase B